MKYTYSRKPIELKSYTSTGEIVLRLVRKSKRMKKPACHI